MSETVVVTYGGTARSVKGMGGTQPTYRDAGFPTVSGPVVRPLHSQPDQPDELDPVLEWLVSDAAVQYRNHWVALNPVTGALLGLADELPHLRRWQAEGALIVFVDPPSRAYIDVDRNELAWLIDGLMVLMHGMEQVPENDLTEIPDMQKLLERLMTPVSVTPKGA